MRDTGRLCGPGKTILETVRGNPDADVLYAVAAFGGRSGNPYLDMFESLCPVVRLREHRAWLPWTAVVLARWARRRRISILHAHDFKTDVLGLMVSGLARIPIVTTVHGYISVSRKSKVYTRVDSWLLRRMHRVIAVSEAMARQFIDTGLPESRIRLVRNCIVLDNYPFGYRCRALRRANGLTDEHLLVGHVGRLSPEKGQARLLRVFPKVLREVPRARLVFAGDGPDMPALRSDASRLGLEDEVFFLGHRSDIREVFADLDLLVLSSDTEGLPNVVLEAGALGIPVVATAVGGTPEVVTDGVTGLLASPDDEDELAEAIIRALTDRAGAGARAERARERIEREFAMDVLIERTHRLYREMAASA